MILLYLNKRKWFNGCGGGGGLSKLNLSRDFEQLDILTCIFHFVTRVMPSAGQMTSQCARSQGWGSPPIRFTGRMASGGKSMNLKTAASISNSKCKKKIYNITVHLKQSKLLDTFYTEYHFQLIIL